MWPLLLFYHAFVCPLEISIVLCLSNIALPIYIYNLALSIYPYFFTLIFIEVSFGISFDISNLLSLAI